MTTAIGVSYLGGEGLGSSWERADPTVVVTAPIGTINDTQPTVTWTYTSPISRAQYSFQIQIRDQDGTTVLYDTFNIVSSGTSYTVPFLLSGGSRYQVWLRASDQFDRSAWATANFDSDLSDVGDYPINRAVGSVYEIGINGEGFMLMDDPERPVTRRSTILEPDRLATSETPFAEAIDRYSFIGASDWSGGAGQRWRNRPDSDPTRFFDSEGVNPFDEDGLHLLNSMSLSQADTYTKPYTVVASGNVFTASADGELTSQTTPGGTETTFTITGGGAPSDMASDGTHWYYTDGFDIFRNSTAADPVTAWSTWNADRIEWIVDRLFASGVDAGNAIVTTFDESGVEEVAGGRFIFPDAPDIPSMAGGDGYAWFVVNRTDSSQIHYWQLGSADTYPAVGLTLPQGQKAQSIGFYLGSLFVFAVEELDAGGYRAIIYQCAAQEGRLLPNRVADFELTNAPTEPGFAGDDRFVVFSWSEMGTTTFYSGVGAIDLSTGGYAKWVSSGATGEAFRPVWWNGKIGIPIAGSGLWVEDESPISSGWLESSISDLGSSLSKVVDRYRVSFPPLPGGGTVGLEYTRDSATSFVSVGEDADVAGLTEYSWDLPARVNSIGYRVTLGATTVSPSLSFVQIQLHPLAIREEILQLPVNCSDRVTGLNGQIIRYSRTGIERVRVLEAMVGNRVKVQDTDWPSTGKALIWEVIDVETRLNGFFDRSANRRVETGMSVVTLRRGL